jgi:hypothetical protein
VGQRTFETRSLYLILAEKLFTLPAANEMLPLLALFAGKYREVGMAAGILKTRPSRRITRCWGVSRYQSRSLASRDMSGERGAGAAASFDQRCGKVLVS